MIVNVSRAAFVHTAHCVVTMTLVLVAGGKSVSYETLRRCPIHFEVKSENKGLEGMLILNNLGADKKYLFGLCEGMWPTAVVKCVEKKACRPWVLFMRISRHIAMAFMSRIAGNHCEGGRRGRERGNGRIVIAEYTTDGGDECACVPAGVVLMSFLMNGSSQVQGGAVAA
jgi:hypothetical protein